MSQSSLSAPRGVVSLGAAPMVAAAIVAVAGLVCPVMAQAGGGSGVGSSAPAASKAAGPAATGAAQNRPSAAMMRYPAISKDFICFAYAGDLWLAPRAGGTAVPLSTRPGNESFPRFSPDGQTLAFTARYEGNPEIYTMPVAGGVGGQAQRITHHPGSENLAGWTADGKNLLFFSNGLSGLPRQTQLYTVAAAGGQPEQLPVPYGAFGGISEDGQWLAYTLHTTDTRTWKRYRGGMATDVWLFNLKTKQSKRITDWEGTDTLPMWGMGAAAGKVYYLSDQPGEKSKAFRLNIWSYDVKTEAREQITGFGEDDVRWPSMGPGDAGQGEIIFQLGSKLRVLDLKSKQTREVSIVVPGSKPMVALRTVEGSKNVSSTSISPTGKRVAASGRGDLWTFPAKEGITRRLTATNGVFERDVAWSPDGRWIAYLSDETGEYELYIRSSGSKEEEKKDEKKKGDAKKEDDKKEESKKEEPKKDDVKKDETKKDEAKKDEGKKDDAKDDDKSGEKDKVVVRKLTSMGPGFRMGVQWSPDSKFIVFHDSNGVMYITDVEKAETKTIDSDPLMNGPTVSFSHDSSVLAYTRTDEASRNSAIWIYNIKSGEKSLAISPMFSSGSPAFDRKGDWLYYTSTQSINNPKYSDIDSSFIYSGSEVMMAAPLRKDVKWPIALKNDDEEIKPAKSEKKDEAKKDEAKKDDKKEEKKEDKAPDAALADDGVSGVWGCTATGPAEAIPGGTVPFNATIKVDAEGKVTGKLSGVFGVVEFTGTFDKASGALKFGFQMNQAAVTIDGKIDGSNFSGSWTIAGNAALRGTVTGSRTTIGVKGDDAKKDDKATGGKDKKEDKKDSKKDEKKDEVLKIDLEGIEARAVMLPLPAGNLGGTAVTDDNKLIYVRSGGRGEGGGPSIKIFDIKDEAKEEKTVTSGGGFELSADGKKILVGTTIYDASAGGGKAQPVAIAGTRMTIDPRQEWRQIVTDTWRIFRDYFYEPTMHGVDWPKVKDHYLGMVEDAASREDVQFILGEMVSELNVGHAYIQDPGDVEAPPASVSVGLLGADYQLVSEGGVKAFKITRIFTGGPWDGDAKGPLSIPGSEVKVGQFILAVNGQPIDTAQDIYSSFIGTADRTTQITVSEKPTLDSSAKEVLVKPVGSEATLRYRAWIEAKRKLVYDKSEGKIGYIYVPNTGVDGQNDLFRQFQGQKGMAALIIDDRWNGGGQIPTRFIELLNRPITNLWARRGGNASGTADWIWPPDSHQGPKAMLINGLAGSGGDMFPWLFKHNKLGKLIGTRTWGGLVGISGNPGLIDGGTCAVPTFGFYETDGTWGIEGHGVDPDIAVIDDPAKMQDGGDPQIDVAVSTLLDEIKSKGFKRPARPASPNRSGMGIAEQDK